ncbi:MAG: hypothetical protein FWF86_08665 [Clostridia bacterium]|nr:hypothetical protein [Clostridia bacterium]
MELAYAAALFLGLAAFLLRRERIRMRKITLLARKMHASPLFTELSPLLKNAQYRAIEQLVVDKTGVAIRYIHPAGSEARFDMREHGFPALSEEKRQALLYILEEFLPYIADTHRYALRKRRILLLNGRFETYFQYTILNAYKSTLTRAPQYSKQKQLIFPEW